MLKTLCSLLLILHLTNIQIAEGSTLSSDIEAIFVLPETRFNGAVFVSQDENVLYQKFKGFRDLEASSEIDKDTQFLIGSISKQFTAVLILQAVDAKLIKLDTPIKEYLPKLQRDWVDRVNIHHLLTHTSGIFSLDSALLFQPGEKFHYSNAGYDLLGLILESVTGKNYADLLQTMCQKCGMHNTFAPISGTFHEMNAILTNFAVGRTECASDGVELPNEFRDSAQNPSSGNISTISDLRKWNKYLHNGQLLTDKTYKLFISSSISRQHRFGKMEYGYGVHLSSDKDLFEISHNGIIPGYISTLLYYPEEKISVIILENRVLWTNEWTLAEQMRVFSVHDGIRECVRKFILLHE